MPFHSIHRFKEPARPPRSALIAHSTVERTKQEQFYDERDRLPLARHGHRDRNPLAVNLPAVELFRDMVMSNDDPPHRQTDFLCKAHGRDTLERSLGYPHRAPDQAHLCILSDGRQSDAKTIYRTDRLKQLFVVNLQTQLSPCDSCPLFYHLIPGAHSNPLGSPEVGIVSPEFQRKRQIS